MNYNQLNGHNRIEFMAKGSLGKNKNKLFQRFIINFHQIFMNCHHCSSFARQMYLSIIITKFDEILLSG